MTNLDLGASYRAFHQELDSCPGLSGKPILIQGAAEIALRLNNSPTFAISSSPPAPSVPSTAIRARAVASVG